MSKAEMCHHCWKNEAEIVYTVYYTDITVDAIAGDRLDEINACGEREYTLCLDCAFNLHGWEPLSDDDDDDE